MGHTVLSGTTNVSLCETHTPTQSQERPVTCDMYRSHLDSSFVKLIATWT